MKRAVLEITEHPQPGNHLLISCEVSFDRDAGQWRAIDDVGNEALDDYSNCAAVRCLMRRVGAIEADPMRALAQVLLTGWQRFASNAGGVIGSEIEERAKLLGLDTEAWLR